MTVPSLPFLLCAIIAAAIYNILPKGVLRRWTLLCVNLAFLLTFASTAIGMIPYVGFLMLGFVLIYLVRKFDAKWLLMAAVVTMVLTFCWLKQYEFLPKAIFFPTLYVTVGMSYVFFRILHMVIDARSEPMVRNASFLSYLNFTLNFTSLVSGPIQRYEDYYETTETKPGRLTMASVGVALERIVVGFFKVWVAAAIISALQKVLEHQVIEAPEFWLRVFSASLLTALYPVYLFCNFSGYTDFVIGIAQLFGIKLPENFDRPFMAASFIEYWSRWHMSLSNWLKTYVYTPLMTASMRRIKTPKLLPYMGALALFVTFFLIGAWHGRTSKFLFFGILNGAGVAANQAYRIFAAEKLGRKRFKEIGNHPLYLFLGRGLTLSWVGFTLLWFWSDWPQLALIVHALGSVGVAIAIAALVIGSCLALEFLRLFTGFASGMKANDQPLLQSHYVRTVGVTIMVICIVAVQSVMTSSAPDIVYKDF